MLLMLGGLAILRRLRNELSHYLLSQPLTDFAGYIAVFS